MAENFCMIMLRNFPTILGFLTWLWFFIPIAGAQEPVNSPNYSINYKVHVTKSDPLLPRVEIQLKGADEIVDMTSLLQEGRYLQFRGDGKITQIGSDIVWRPMGLHASLSYRVVVPHERKSGVYDSYGKKDWVITRTADLFPRKRVQFRKPGKSLTTVTFDLPTGWSAVSEMPKIGENSFRAFESGDYEYDRPTGWLLYGKIVSRKVSAREAQITIAYPYDFIKTSKSLDEQRVLRREKYLKWFDKKLTHMQEIYSKVIPLMADFLPEYAKEFLVIVGKDPMWRGGLSGENSLYLNRGVPNITKDHTSTLVHEYFHVSDGFIKDKLDAEWLVEGLAEFYSLRLLYDAKINTKKDFHAGIVTLKEAGQWGKNLTKSKNQKVLYKNAPVILFVLDEMLREKTGGVKSLNDVMPLLSEESRAINTATFQSKVEKVYGESLKGFFRAYVYGGKVPDYKKYLK